MTRCQAALSVLQRTDKANAGRGACACVLRSTPSLTKIKAEVGPAPSMRFRPRALPMHIHFQTRTLRRTAFAVLLVWLFSVAAGVANACLLETPAASVVVLKVAVPEPSHPHALAGHSGESDPAKESCLKSCDGSTQALPKAQAGVDQSDPGPAPLVTTLWTASTQPVLASRQFDKLQLPAVGPPLRVRYSRLAL